ncbi:MAG: class I SAM-dependent methyltransferase [Longimicrobiales bacterium]|nr:class I SAM-dependent methyltransferase [Longimicrobiales bacterium]
MPSQEALAAYNAHYFDEAHAGVAEAESARPFHRAINHLRFRHVARHLEAVQDGLRVLEVGPGLGDFAHHMTTFMPSTKYSVVESDDSCRSALAKLGYRHWSALDQVPADEKFDLVVMSHVLEHMSDPVAELTRLRGFMAPGAILFIEVPCRDCEHKPSDEPHLLFFDKEPMARLLSEVGLEPQEISWHGRSIRYLRRHKGFMDKVLRRIGALAVRRGLLPISADLAAIPDPADRAAVWAFRADRTSDEPAWWLRTVARMPARNGIDS